MSVNKTTLPGQQYQNVLTQSGLSGLTISKVEIYKSGSLFVLALTPSAGNPTYFKFLSGQVAVNTKGIGLDEWGASGDVLITPQAA